MFPWQFANYIVPGFILGYLYIMFLNYLTSMNVSVNDLYIEPKKNKGVRNCSISVCIIIISPGDNIPILA